MKRSPSPRLVMILLRPLVRIATRIGLAYCLGLGLAPIGGLAAPDRATVRPPQFEGDQVRFDWDTGGDLQIAPSPNGPWTTVHAPQVRNSTAQLPAVAQGAFFFRIVDQGRPGDPQAIVGGDPSKPWRIAKAFLRKADAGAGGNALLEAELEPGQNPPPKFPLFLNDRTVIFHDDGQGGDQRAGDGVFTTSLLFDVNELLGANQFTSELVKLFPVIGSFDGRTAVNAQKPALFDVAAFNLGERILIHPSPFSTGLPNGLGLALAGGPGRPGVSKAALLGRPDLLTQFCFTNVDLKELTLTNFVTVPEVTFTNRLIGTIPHAIVTNILVDEVFFDPNPTTITSNQVVIEIINTFCPTPTNVVVTNSVFSKDVVKLGIGVPSVTKVVTNIVMVQVPCLVTNKTEKTITIILPPGLHTNHVIKEVVIGTVDEPVFQRIRITNFVVRPLVLFSNLAFTNIICTNLAIGSGTNINVTNVQTLLDRPIFWDKSLMVTDLSVVEDPQRTFDPCTGQGTRMGAWTFGRLMSDLANQPVTGINPSDFARRWLRSWQTEQVINFDTVANRNGEIVAQVIKGWEAASGGADKPLDLSIAPFRLLAIVNRVDLRLNPGYGGVVGDDPCNPSCLGGEGRFVFGLIQDAFNGGNDRPPAPGYGGGGGGGGNNKCDPAQFTVIFEYCVPKRTCGAIKEYALEWYQLSQLQFGDTFNLALQQITDQFAARGADPTRKPNQSSLNQLRANELLRQPWELREWRLFGTDSDAGQLREVTVKQTPDFDHNFQPIITEFCLANLGQILAEKHTVPLMWRSPGKPQVPFLGGVAPMPTQNFFWDGPAPAASSIPNEVRHKFSLNTCNGCHAGETRTAFIHVSPRAAGQKASLSDFLTGLNMPKLDPADNVTPRVFADLKRREDDLLRLITEPCFFQIFHEPVAFTD